MYYKRNWFEPTNMRIRKFKEGDQILYNHPAHGEIKTPFEFVREYPNYLLFRSVFGGYYTAIDRQSIWRYCNEEPEKQYKKSDSFEFFQQFMAANKAECV